MSLNNYIRISVLSLMLILGMVPNTQAQYPTLDISAITQGIKGVVQQANQIKTQIMESSVVGSINSAIGDAKAAMSKFSLDEIKAKAKEAEKKLKEANKLKKITENIKKAKEAYEQKKKQFDNYKKKLADAKAKVEAKVDEAKSKIDEAKAVVNDVKSKVDDAKAKVEAKVDEAKSKIDEAKAVVNDVKSKVDDTKAKVEAKVGEAKSKIDEAKAVVNDAKSQINTIKSNVGTTDSGLAPTVGEAEEQADDNINIENSVSLNSELPLTESGQELISPASAVDETETPVEPELISPSNTAIDEAKEVSATEGVSAGVQTINASFRKALNEKDTKTLEAIANIDPADIIVSDSKVYDDGTTPELNRKAFKTPDSKTIIEADNKSDTIEKATIKSSISDGKITSPLLTKNPDIKLNSPKELTRVDSLTLDKKEELKPAVSVDKKVDAVVAKPVVNKALTETIQKISSPLLTKNPINTKAGLVKEPSTGGNLKVNRQKFQAKPVLQKNSKLWLDDGDRSRHQGIKLSFNETLKFGSAECDYNNSIVSGDDGEIVILSEVFAKSCCLKSEDLKDLNVIRDCARNLIKKMSDPDSDASSEAKAVFQQISAEQLKYGLAESLDNTNDSTSYLKDVLETYKKDMTQSSSTKDDISIVTMTNTQLLYLFNRLRRIYTSSLATGTITSLDSIDSEILNEEVDVGIEKDDNEYEASVSRADVEYPVLPENFAKQCAIKIKDGIDAVKTCYMNAVKKIHNPDIEVANSGLNFAKNIKYQSILDTMAKSLYQKVKSAEYDKKLQETKDQATDATDLRRTADALFNSDYEMQEIMDDIVNLLATRIANNSISEITTLDPLSTDEQN